MKQLKPSDIQFLANYFGLNESHLVSKESLLKLLEKRKNSINEKAFQLLYEKTQNTPLESIIKSNRKAALFEEELKRKGRKVYRKG